MNEITGSVPPPNRPKPTELSVQRSDQPITCSANALINAIRISEGRVEQFEAQKLIQKTLDTQDSLAAADKENFAYAHGVELKIWSLPATQIANQESIAVQFADNLERTGPAMISISSALSKRDRSIAPSVAFKEEVVQGRTVVHRVVAQKAGNKVSIIDSYNPQEPEEFDITDLEEQKRLSAWLISAAIDNNAAVGNPNLTLNKDDVLKIATDWLNQPFDDSHKMRAMTYIHTANVEYVTAIKLPADMQKALDTMVSDTYDVGEGLFSLDRKRTLAQEIFARKLLASDILKTCPTVYAGSYTDVELPLALGSRHIIMVDPEFENPTIIANVIGRIEAIKGEHAVTREGNILRFNFNFGDGDESVTIELIPKPYNPKKPAANLPFNPNYQRKLEAAGQTANETNTQDPLFPRHNYILPQNVGVLLGFQSHFEQITADDTGRIAKGGYIIDNRDYSVAIPTGLWAEGEYIEWANEGYPYETARRKYNAMGLESINLRGFKDYRYTFLKKQ